MITKAHLISSLNKLPENLSFDELIDHLIFVEKVEKGLSDLENGLVKSKEEARQVIKKWLK
jgi:hypothetical protein